MTLSSITASTLSDDENQQRDIEGFAGRGVGLEDDLVQAFAAL